MELRPPSYFTLAALIDGPLHGYAIMQRASELSDGSVRVSTGTLYSILDRALAGGLVTVGNPYVVTGRERRDYALTPAGRLVLREETAQLARAASVVGTKTQSDRSARDMSRQLIGRTLVRLYPAEVRRARGNELVGTAA